MRRKLAFSGFILGTCITAIAVFFMLIGTIVLAEISVGLNDGGLVIALVVLELLLFVTILVLNAVSISSTTLAYKFNKRKGLVITAIVFNFIAVFMCIGSIISSIDMSAELVIGIVFYVIFILALITANVLVIVDLARNDKALKKEESQDENAVVQASTQTFAEQRETIDGLDEELNKLLILKAKNLINDEEFAELKRHAIEKRMK